MGKGKGAPEFWVCRVKPGRVMFELDGVPRDLAEEAFRLAAMTLPVDTRFVTRLGEGAGWRIVRWRTSFPRTCEPSRGTSPRHSCCTLPPTPSPPPFTTPPAPPT